MLNRRILRIKAFKVLYGYAENPALSLKEAEAQLEISCEATRDLHLFMLAIISPLVKEAQERIEAARNKFNPTEEERNPNMKFVNSQIARIFDEDPDFQKLLSRKKLSWERYDAFIRDLYNSIKTKDYYKDYMNNPDSDIEGEVKLFTRMYEEEFVDNSEMEKILEDLSIYWNEDLAYSLTYCCKSLSEFTKSKTWRYVPLYHSDMKKEKDSAMDNDKAFVVKLLRSSYNEYDTYSSMLASSVPGWDKDRLFTTDIVLIVMGLAEVKNFPEIPVKVSINEYVEISKYYGTPKSRSFVNGLLDKLVTQMTEENKIKKAGKGLL